MRHTITVTLAAACLATTPLAAQEDSGTTTPGGAQQSFAQSFGVDPGPAEFHDIEIDGLSVEALVGSDILGASGDHIGEVSDVLIIEGEPDKIVMAIRFGLGTRNLLIPLDETEIQKADDDTFRVRTSVTEDTIDQLAVYDAA